MVPNGSNSLKPPRVLLVQAKNLISFRDLGKIFTIWKAMFIAYRWSEILAVLPLVLCWVVLTLAKLVLPDAIVNKATGWIESAISFLLGQKVEYITINGEKRELCFSVAGSLDTDFTLVNGILANPNDNEENPASFPCKKGICYGNAAFLAMCMKLAYEKWEVVRGIVNDIWKDGKTGRMQPSFVAGFSFDDMVVSEGDRIKGYSSLRKDLGSDAFLLEVSPPGSPAGSGRALVLAFRGTEPTELVDFQSDFDLFPKKGNKGRVHPGFLMSLGLDKNLEPMKQCKLQYKVLEGPKSDFKVINRDDVAASTTPYDLLRNQIEKYMDNNPQAQLFVTGHSLGGALAAVFTAAFLFDKSLPETLKDRLGATYTFGQPRVGNYTFCCNFRAALLRLTPSALAEPLELLTGRYVRVCNTYDIVTHIPPTYGQLYQHTGALAYLKADPGQVVFQSEMPAFVWRGIWVSAVKKALFYGQVFWGFNANWHGRENWLRQPFRLAACILPRSVAGLSDHMPGDYYQQVVNSKKEAWQPLGSQEEMHGPGSFYAFIAAAVPGDQPFEDSEESAFKFSDP